MTPLCWLGVATLGMSSDTSRPSLTSLSHTALFHVCIHPYMSVFCILYISMFLCMYVGLFIFYDMFSLLLSVSVSLCCYCMYMFTSVTSSSFVLPCLHFMCLTVYMYDSICMVGMCPHISMNSYRSIRCDFHTMFFSVYTFSYCVFLVYAMYVYV